METKMFPTSAVISATVGVLVDRNGIGVVYEVLDWMTGESLFTHQLPRVGREAQAVMLTFWEPMATVVEEAKQVNGDNWQDWLLVWEERYGREIAVPKLGADSHELIDPLSELAEQFHPDQTIVIEV